MIFTQTSVTGVFQVATERLGDERGFFARTYDGPEFERHGLDPTIAQCSVSFNTHAGTLRGMHFQADPYGEAKLVRCTRGAIYDVALDLRPGSSTYLAWTGAELTADSGHALFIPPGCAHGFQTLDETTEVLYQISVPYQPGAGRGVRWDDPAFGIEWPEAPTGRTISERDASYPDFAG